MRTGIGRDPPSFEVVRRWICLPSITLTRQFEFAPYQSLEEGSAHAGKGKGGANSDILTPTLLLEEVERHFPRLTVSDEAIAGGVGRNASVARSQGDCSIMHPHVHFTPDYSDMSRFGGPFADGKRRRSFLNRRGKVVHGSYGNTYKFNNKPNGA